MYKKLIVSSLILITLLGCSSTKPKLASFEYVHGKPNTKQVKDCGYIELNKPEFLIDRKEKGLVQYKFAVNPRLASYAQSAPSLYRNLVNNKFKVLSTGHTSYYGNIGARFQQIILKNEPYELYTQKTTALITPSCEIFYFSDLNSFNIMSKGLTQADGDPITIEDYTSIVGAGSLSKVEIETKVTFDEFDNAYELTTDKFLNFFIRGSFSKKYKKIIFNQLYADVEFSDKWGHLKKAKDKKGFVFDITKIETDVDCGKFGCNLTETVGITLPLKYLKANNDGFTLKLTGTREVIIEIPGTMVKSYIKSMEEIMVES